MRKNIPAVRDQRRELRKFTRIYNEALQADPWDRAAVDAALLNVQMIRTDIRKMISKSFVDAVESLEPEDRALLRDTARHRGPRAERGLHDHRPRCSEYLTRD